MSKADYAKRVKNITLILEGKKDALYRRIHREMQQLSKERKYEEAAVVRDQLRAIGALYSGTKDVNYYKEAEAILESFNPSPFRESLSQLVTYTIERSK